jgi:hypothetical protein
MRSVAWLVKMLRYRISRDERARCETAVRRQNPSSGYWNSIILGGGIRPAGSMLAVTADASVDVPPLFPSRERHQQRTRCSFLQITLAERAWFVATAARSTPFAPSASRREPSRVCNRIGELNKVNPWQLGYAGLL